MDKEIFVMAEQREGLVEDISFSLLSDGKRLNAKMGNSHLLSAIVMGYGMEDLGNRLGSYGADRVYYFDNQQLERYQSDLSTDLITKLIREKSPVLFLLGATSLGSDLAPRVAARLKVGLVTHCVDIIVNKDKLEVVKPVSDEYLYQRIAFRNHGVKMMTFSLDAMSREDPDPSKKAEVIRILPEIDERKMRARFIRFIKADAKTIGLAEADVIVSGGRGVGKEAFEMIYGLADALNGSVGGTRPIIDWGILPHERQIGQTGIDVFPTVLITCGVSGANEFTVGVEGSKLIIAINWDRRARIFKFADLGIIGDLHKIIPILIDLVKGHKQNSPINLCSEGTFEP